MRVWLDDTEITGLCTRVTVDKEAAAAGAEAEVVLVCAPMDSRLPRLDPACGQWLAVSFSSIRSVIASSADASTPLSLHPVIVEIITDESKSAVNLLYLLMYYNSSIQTYIKTIWLNLNVINYLLIWCIVNH